MELNEAIESAEAYLTFVERVIRHQRSTSKDLPLTYHKEDLLTDQAASILAQAITVLNAHVDDTPQGEELNRLLDGVMRVQFIRQSDAVFSNQKQKGGTGQLRTALASLSVPAIFVNTGNKPELSNQVGCALLKLTERRDGNDPTWHTSGAKITLERLSREVTRTRRRATYTMNLPGRAFVSNHGQIEVAADRRKGQSSKLVTMEIFAVTSAKIYMKVTDSSESISLGNRLVIHKVLLAVSLLDRLNNHTVISESVSEAGAARSYIRGRPNIETRFIQADVSISLETGVMRIIKLHDIRTT